MSGFGVQLVCRGELEPCFFMKQSVPNVNDKLILSPFFNQLTDEEKSYGHFIQDNATAHTVNNSVVAFDEVFGERVISRGLWPPQSHSLNPCDLYLWRTLKEKCM
jgi:hypothetical protein